MTKKLSGFLWRLGFAWTLSWVLILLLVATHNPFTKLTGWEKVSIAGGLILMIASVTSEYLPEFVDYLGLDAITALILIIVLTGPAYWMGGLALAVPTVLLLILIWIANSVAPLGF